MLTINIIGLFLSLIPGLLNEIFVAPGGGIGPNELQFVGVIMIYVLLHIIIMVPMFIVFTNALLLTFKLWWRRNEKRKPLPNTTSKIINRARNEYGVKLNDDDASVLALLLCGKDTIRQIEQHTGMYRHHIKYIIKMLRKKELIVPVKITPVASLTSWADSNGICDKST